jgi:hypothetical protein
VRGGTKKKSSKAKPVPSSRRRNHLSDDDDDDEYENDEEENVRSKRHRSKESLKKSGKKGFGSLFSWGTRAKSSKKNKNSPGFREKLDQMTKSGQSVYKDLFRRAKVLLRDADCI